MAGGRCVLSLRNPWARLRGSWCTAASRGPHRDPDLQGGGSRDSLQLQSVCSHCSHQSHAADAGFLQRGFYDPAALQRGGWAAVSGLHAAADCSNTQLSQLQHSWHQNNTDTTLLFIGRYVFHFAQATALEFKSTKKIQYVQECVAVSVV